MSRARNRSRLPRRATRPSAKSDRRSSIGASRLRRPAHSSLAVTGEHLLTGAADPAAVGLQAAEDGEHVVLAVFADELFAIAYDVRMAGGAFLIGALRD